MHLSSSHKTHIGDGYMDSPYTWAAIQSWTEFIESEIMNYICSQPLSSRVFAGFQSHSNFKDKFKYFFFLSLVEFSLHTRLRLADCCMLLRQAICHFITLTTQQWNFVSFWRPFNCLIRHMNFCNPVIRRASTFASDCLAVAVAVNLTAFRRPNSIKKLLLALHQR